MWWPVLCRFCLLFVFPGPVFHKGIESIIYLRMSIGQPSLAGKDREILIRMYYRKEDKKIITFQRMWRGKTGQKVHAGGFKLCRSAHHKAWRSRSPQAQSFLQKRWCRLMVCSWLVGPRWVRQVLGWESPWECMDYLCFSTIPREVKNRGLGMQPVFHHRQCWSQVLSLQAQMCVTGTFTLTW